MRQEIDLSVVSCGSVDQSWEKKPQKPIISKIIKRDLGDYALILTQDPSKPLRFLYLTLLIDRNRVEHLKTIIMKLTRLIVDESKIAFEQVPIQMKEVSKSLEKINKNLKILLNKIQKDKNDQLIALKLCEQHAIVDPVLTLALRAIANSQQFRIKTALSCNIPLTLANIFEMMRKFGINKNQKNQLNRFVIFCDMKQIDLEFFKYQGVNIQHQMLNCQELFDASLIKYEQDIILQQMYCQF